MDKRLKIFVPRKIKAPFSNEQEAAKAIKNLFSKGLGAKVLDQLLLDLDYHIPVKPDTAEAMAFNNGIKYALNHILHAISIDYEEIEEEQESYD